MKLVIAGLSGKMGQEILRLAEASPKWDFVAGLSRSENTADKKFSSLKSVSAPWDVLIDFSSPEMFEKTLADCVSLKKPFLSGTTGLSKDQKQSLETAAKSIAVLWAPNTAPGVHLFKRILQHLQIPASFDVQLTEYHHRMKKDKPSGTGIMLQDELLKKRQDIPEPISIRGGGIYGIHRIELMSAGETITLQHEALGRGLFAQGALDAAEWLSSQGPGLYTMDDFLKEMK